jgi:hypothetical protein
MKGDKKQVESMRDDKFFALIGTLKHFVSTSK